MMQLVVPMSGIGKRFKDKGYVNPKYTLDIGGISVLESILNNYPKIESVLLIVNEQDWKSEQAFFKKILSVREEKIEFEVIDNHKLGPAWAIHKARRKIRLDLPVSVNYCDFSWTWNFDSLQEILRRDLDGIVVTYTGFNPHMIHNSKYAYIRKDTAGLVCDIREKESFTDTPMSEEASAGTYIFKNGRILLEAIDNQITSQHVFNEEFYISLTYKNMIERGLKIESFLIDQFVQLGTPEDYSEYSRWKRFFKVHNSKSVQDLTGLANLAVLAAGKGQRFLNEGYGTPKPFLKTLGGELATVIFSAFGTKTLYRSILVRDEFHDYLKNYEFSRIELIRLSTLTKGQAESALICMGRMKDGNCVVASCDSILYPNGKELEDLNSQSMLVWVTKPTELNFVNASNYGWVEVLENQEVGRTAIKTSPENFSEARVITGTFAFGEVADACKLLTAFLQDGNTVNGEYYLDTLIEFAKNKGWKVLAREPRAFASLGTPTEYETFRYWERFFETKSNYLELM